MRSLVYYAVDNSILHLFLARLSLQSLRRQNPSIPVRVFLFGTKKASTRRLFESLGASVTCLPKPEGLPAMFLKWHALRHVKAARVLYVDADTLFFEDPEKLLGQFKAKDFYAREEYGTRPGVGYQLLGNCIMEPQIHPKKYKAISTMLGFKPQPIFNTGVMIFNRGFAARMAERVFEMDELYRTFVEKPAYYPAENMHIADEVISSIVFGRLSRFSCGKIPKAFSPWYCEWTAGAVTAPGVVMHSWSKYSPFFVREFAGPRVARKLPFLIPVEETYSEV